MFHETNVINYLNQQGVFKEKLLKIIEVDDPKFGRWLSLEFESITVKVDCDMINTSCIKNLILTINENLGEKVNEFEKRFI